MDLPKIKNEDLPEELKELLGDSDAVFDPIVDPLDVMVDIQYDPDTYYEQRTQDARRFVEARKKLNQLKTEQRLTKSKDSDSINTDS